MSYNVSEMAEIATVFQEAFEHVLKNLGDTPSAVKARQFAGYVLLTERPYMMVTEEGLTRMTEMVFSDDAVRDFVFTLHFVFISRMGMDPVSIGKLAQSVAQGLSLRGVGEYRAIPDVIHNRLSTYDDIFAVLQANTWFMVVLLIPLFLVFSADPSVAKTNT